ncbi:MAG: CoB--CoM heterodisulfide reductase iron-sulfur subunit B family protein [Chloroflexota bacterium]
MKMHYYPGCTLKNKGKNLDRPAVSAMAMLGVELVELPRWNCCGAVHSLTSDDLIHQVAPVRNLVRAKEDGATELVTLCALCYQTLARANLLIRGNAKKRDTINAFMDEEIDYLGEVEVVHLLQAIKTLGFAKVSERVRVPLKGLKVAPYYGCTLLRPREIAIDDPDRPTVLQDLLKSLGAGVTDFAPLSQCCGSYHIVGNPDVVPQCAWNILHSAVRSGAEAVVTSCPLCDYNLGREQERLKKEHESFKGLPVIYFTQLLALALGVPAADCQLDGNFGDPATLLTNKGLLN